MDCVSDVVVVGGGGAGGLLTRLESMRHSDPLAGGGGGRVTGAEVEERRDISNHSHGGFRVSILSYRTVR